MKRTDMPHISRDEVIVVYTCLGGIPDIEVITRDLAVAATAFNRAVAKKGHELTAAEAAAMIGRGECYDHEVEEIDDRLYLAHSADFDAYIEVVALR